MKKIFLLFITGLLLTGCNNQNLPQEGTFTEESFNKDFTLSLTKTKKCTNQVIEYYSYENRKVYFVCLDEIYLKRENSKDMTLKYHFQNANQSFDRSIEQLVSDMENIDILKDGGTKIYKKDDYTIIKCNTIDGNQNIYIGDISLEYQQEYCK